MSLVIMQVKNTQVVRIKRPLNVDLLSVSAGNTGVQSIKNSMTHACT